MQVERISAGMVCPQKMQVGNTKNCPQMKPQNECDAFVSKKNVAFGSGEGTGIGMFLGWAAGVVLATAALPATMIGATVATVAGVAGAAGGAVIGDKVTGEDKK